MTISIRTAVAEDEQGIRALTRGERINPTKLRWTNFIVAVENGRTIAAAQIRRHKDGTRELGSLIVEARHRGRGVAAHLIDALLINEQDRVFMITSRAYLAHYARWGFGQIAVDDAPACIRRNYRLGHYGGRIMSTLQRRRFNPLAILVRPSSR